MSRITEEEYRAAMDRMAVILDAGGVTHPDQELVSDYVEQLQVDPEQALVAQTELVAEHTERQTQAMEKMAHSLHAIAVTQPVDREYGVSEKARKETLDREREAWGE